MTGIYIDDFPPLFYFFCWLIKPNELKNNALKQRICQSSNLWIDQDFSDFVDFFSLSDMIKATFIADSTIVSIIMYQQLRNTFIHVWHCDLKCLSKDKSTTKRREKRAREREREKQNERIRLMWF